MPGGVWAWIVARVLARVPLMSSWTAASQRALIPGCSFYSSVFASREGTFSSPWTYALGEDVGVEGRPGQGLELFCGCGCSCRFDTERDIASSDLRVAVKQEVSETGL